MSHEFGNVLYCKKCGIKHNLAFSYPCSKAIGGGRFKVSEVDRDKKVIHYTWTPFTRWERFKMWLGFK